MRRRGKRPVFRYSAARSPPIGAWQRRRWRNWVSTVAVGRAARPCRAAIFRAAISLRFWPIFQLPTLFLPKPLARRLARAYGTRASRILGEAKAMDGLGENFGGGLTEAEIGYLIAEEFARTADDILWRRSKLGLHVPPDTAARLSRHPRFFA